MMILHKKTNQFIISGTFNYFSEGPAYVHMVDIDPVVMDACSKFMPKVMN